MAIEKLVCSNCRGVLKWNPDDRTFTCENCGTKYQTDNEFTYRIVNEAEIKRLEMEAEEKRLEREAKAKENSLGGALKPVARKLFIIFVCVLFLILINWLVRWATVR